MRFRLDFTIAVSFKGGGGGGGGGCRLGGGGGGGGGGNKEIKGTHHPTLPQPLPLNPPPVGGGGGGGSFPGALPEKWQC